MSWLEICESNLFFLKEKDMISLVLEESKLILMDLFSWNLDQNSSKIKIVDLEKNLDQEPLLIKQK